MKIAITGGTGFVGRHLARNLSADGHHVVLIARGKDSRDPAIRSLANATFVPVGTGSVEQLAQAFAGCDAVAHCAGINREIGEQTYQRVHVRGTQNVVDAARTAGVRKILLLSFLRARPSCGSAYHESKWAAEEIMRNSGLDFTVIKAGMIYGKGDHMLDHLTHALHSFPLFARVGLKEKPIRPVAVEDVAQDSSGEPHKRPAVAGNGRGDRPAGNVSERCGQAGCQDHRQARADVSISDFRPSNLGLGFRADDDHSADFVGPGVHVVGDDG